MISVREAMDRIFEQASPLKVQTMNVGPDLVGHVLAEDVVSPRNVPSGPSTNIDGYAVRGELLSSLDLGLKRETRCADICVTEQLVIPLESTKS